MTAQRTALPGTGKVMITGVVEEEEMGGGSRTLRRKSMARGSVDNVLTVLKRFGLQPDDFDLHINFPGGIPIDGPSAGISMATAITSAMLRIPVDNRVAMTGEVSIHGYVKPIGGVVAKVEAAFQAGASKVIIPQENWQDIFANLNGLEVIPVATIDEVFHHVLNLQTQDALVNNAVQPDVPVPPTIPMLHANPNVLDG